MPREIVDGLVQQLDGGPTTVTALEKLASTVCSGGPDADTAVAALAAAVAAGATAPEGSRAYKRAANAAGALGQAVRGGAAEPIASQPSALPSLVEALRGEGYARTNAAATLMALSGVPAAAARILQQPDCLAGLVGALSKGKEEAVYGAAHVLTRLAAISPKAARRVGDCAGAVPALVSALPRAAAVMAALSESGSLVNRQCMVQLVAGCLESISKAGASYAQAVAAAPGVFPALWGLLTSGREVDAEAAAELLAMLASAGPEAAVALTDAPLLSALATLLTGPDDRMAGLACVVLYNAAAFGGAEPTRRIAAAAGVLTALARLAGSGNSQLAGTAVFVLVRICELSRAEACRVAAAPGALGALSAALRRCRDDPAAATAYKAAAVGLSHIASADAVHASLVAAAAPDMVELLARALSAPGCQGTAAAACQALGRILIACPELEARIYDAGAVEACVGLLRSSELAGHGVAALNNACLFLADADPDRCMAVPGLFEALARAAGSGDAGVERQAARAFAHTAEAAPQHGRRLAASAEALQALVGLLGSSEAEVAEAAACALRAAAVEAPGPVAAALAAPSVGLQARALLLQPLQSLPAEEGGAQTAAAWRTGALRSRVAAFEVLAAAAGKEAGAVRHTVCAACGQVAGAGVRLRPCRGCEGGPAGGVLYCGAACQRAHWGQHKAFCKLGAAAAPASHGAISARVEPSDAD